MNERLIKQIVTPTNSDGSTPTIMANWPKRGSWWSYLSTGHYPQLGVFELWESDSDNYSYNYRLRELVLGHTEPAEDKPIELFIAALASGEYNGRNISNANRQTILDAVMGLKANQYVRLRATTPEERLSIMGVSSKDIELMKSGGATEAQLCKQAGNSIVVDVLYKIFKNLTITKNETKN